jgi:hypothetical protein
MSEERNKEQCERKKQGYERG